MIHRPNARVEFYKCVLNSDLSGDNEHMVSTVFFYFTHKGEKHDLHADVKHKIGANFEVGTYEVSLPAGYKGPFNHKAFSNEAVNYLGLVIPTSQTVKRDTERYAITFPVGMIVEFDVAEPELGG